MITKTILLTLSLGAATLLTGCNGVAVVESGPRYGYAGTQVYYDDDRPYYYYGGARRWGYPVGYAGHRRGYYGGGGGYAHVDVENNVENNYNRTVYNRNVKKVYKDADGNRQNYNNKAKTTNVYQRPQQVQQRPQQVQQRPQQVQQRPKQVQQRPPAQQGNGKPKGKGDDEKTTNKKGNQRA